MSRRDRPRRGAVATAEPHDALRPDAAVDERRRTDRTSGSCGAVQGDAPQPRGAAARCAHGSAVRAPSHTAPAPARRSAPTTRPCRRPSSDPVRAPDLRSEPGGALRPTWRSTIRVPPASAAGAYTGLDGALPRPARDTSQPLRCGATLSWAGLRAGVWDQTDVSAPPRGACTRRKKPASTSGAPARRTSSMGAADAGPGTGEMCPKGRARPTAWLRQLFRGSGTALAGPGARRPCSWGWNGDEGHPHRMTLVAPFQSMFGGVLLSHTVSRAVPSALKGLASGFGMEPGVSLSL